MLFNLIEGLGIWLCFAFIGGCALGSFLRACADDQLQQPESRPMTGSHAAPMAHQA